MQSTGWILFVQIFFCISNRAKTQYVPNFYDDCGTDVPVVQCRKDPCLTSVCAGYPEATCRTNLCGKCKAEFIQDDQVVDCSHTPEWFDNCPRDVAIVQCAKDPCIGKTCEFYPQARCRTNLCGACRAEFVLNDRVINCGSPPSNSCPAGKQLVACLRNPCEDAACPAHPAAACIPNYCGGCFASFHLNGEVVSCDKDPPGAVGQVRVPCNRTEFGCCEDGETTAKDSNKEGCPGIFTTCGAQRSRAIMSNFRRRYAPTCNIDGTYTSIQCWKFVGVCWCVDLEGVEIDGTRSVNRKPRCPRRDAVLEGPSVRNCRILPFGCCKDGKTAATGPYNEGCPGSESACWNSHYGCCPDGKTAAAGTNFESCPRQPTRCEKERDKIVKSNNKPLTGLYVPQCNRDGDYDQIQCHGSKGYCWCVDKSGREFKGTKMKGRPDCSIIVPTCVDLRKDCLSYLSYCSIFPKYMKTYCAKSCKYCVGDTVKIVTRKPTKKTEKIETTATSHKETSSAKPSAGTVTTDPRASKTEQPKTETSTPVSPTKQACGSEFGCCSDGLLPALGPNYLGCPVYKSLCTMPVAAGNCRFAFKRYFYNPQQMKCDEFYYGGCGGNSNNFKTKQDCLKTCHKGTVS